MANTPSHVPLVQRGPNIQGDPAEYVQYNGLYYRQIINFTLEGAGKTEFLCACNRLIGLIGSQSQASFYSLAADPFIDGHWEATFVAGARRPLERIVYNNQVARNTAVSPPLRTHMWEDYNICKHPNSEPYRNARSEREVDEIRAYERENGRQHGYRQGVSDERYANTRKITELMQRIAELEAMPGVGNIEKSLTPGKTRYINLEEKELVS